MTSENNDSGLSPDIQRIIKLESIFTPNTRNKRDEAFKKLEASGETDGRLTFVHYTSAEAALNIIRSKRIWMRNATCMTDYSEVLYGFEILGKFFSDKSKRDIFNEAINECAPGAAQDAINLFAQWWQDIQYNTYISSISEHDKKEDRHGRLSMWRAFGGNAARVAIVFKVPRFSEGALKLQVVFCPVSYQSEDEVHKEIFDVIKNIADECAFLRSIDRNEIINWVFSMLLINVTCLKHEGFREEREWRTIYSPKRRHSPLVESAIEVIGGVPQPVYKLPIDKSVDPSLADLDFLSIIDHLIIGPSPYAYAMKAAFATELSNAGVTDAWNRVFDSKIPIRD